MDEKEKIETERLLEEIKAAVRDIFIATVRKRGDELTLRFPNGQKFALTVWEEKPSK